MRNCRAIFSGMLFATLLVPAAASGAPVGSSPQPPAEFSQNVTFTLPTDLKWTGREGRLQTTLIYGDPKKEGPYGILYKWFPGNFSKPHFHDQTRWGYVISGTWWVSSANVPDESATYPMRAGTFVVDLADKVHWDGVRSADKEPALVLVTGIGPVKTVEVDADGKPLPPGH